MTSECNHIEFCPFYEETTEDGTKTVICKEKECPMYYKTKTISAEGEEN